MVGTTTLGIDLGTVNVKLVAVRDGSVLSVSSCAASGNHSKISAEMIGRTLQDLGIDGPVPIGITGSATSTLSESLKEFGQPQVVNEVVAAASAVSATHENVRTILDLGGQFSKWILLDQSGRVHDFALNGLCAAGSGAFLEQQATRLKMNADELGNLAESAERGATIAGRCSVFAKSDMIHLQQKGTPPEEIAYGLCLSLARTFVSTILEGRSVEPPVVLIGGGALNRGLLRAFRETLEFDGDQLTVYEQSLYACALGAATAASKSEPIDLRPWLDRSGKKQEIRKFDDSSELSVLKLRPSQTVAAQETLLSAASEQTLDVHIGIDVGSVSTNVIVLSKELDLIESIYLPTGGRPVTALDDSLGILEEKYGDRLNVLSVGATGSGRHLASRLVGADLVRNEITAQLVSAAHYCPEVDTIFEIGGQDSKFIDARQGMLRDFEMNKICAAGTGSFLEEQAERLGVSIIGEFTELALQGTKPVDLGSRCTVFMDAELCRAMSVNAPVEDLCAGLAYSVARNYLDKVVAGREIGKTVLFQGGTSANGAVVSAFERILNRPIKVHPHGRVSGAIGAALLSARAQPLTSQFRGLASCRDHEMKSFQCKKCENRCQVNKVKVGNRIAHFGDVCERFTAHDQSQDTTKSDKKERLFPELFAARSELFEKHLIKPVSKGKRQKIGLVRASLMAEYLPFWTFLLTDLGFEPVVIDQKSAHTIETTGKGLPPEVCFPLKRASAQVSDLLESEKVSRVLMPSVLEVENRQENDRIHTCMYVQQVSDMVRASHGNLVLTPQLGISFDPGLQREAINEFAKNLRVPKKAVQKAWNKALEHQKQFVIDRRRLGEQALRALNRRHGKHRLRPVIVMGKPYNLYDSVANLNLAHHLDRLGFAAIPMDLLPLNDERLSDNWWMLAWHLNRDQLRSLRYMANTSNIPIFPIHVSSYGCGPDAFTLKHLERSWGKRPRLFLEFDEHRGEAGLITRLEAFADEIDDYLDDPSRSNKWPLFKDPKPRDNLNVPKGTKCYIAYAADHVYAYSGVFRRVGLDPKILKKPDAETHRLAAEVSSGRECHPYALIAGDLAKLVKEGNLSEGDRFFIPASKYSCLLCQYGEGFRHVLETLGEKRLKIFDQHLGEAPAVMGYLGLMSLYEGLTIIDYLTIEACFLRPREVIRGSVNQALDQCLHWVEDSIARSEDTAKCLRRCLNHLHNVELGPEQPRPIIGVTGDLYTRINPAGNGSLFERLEGMGCIVWPSPFYGAMPDFDKPQNVRRWLAQGVFKDALFEASSVALQTLRSSRLHAVLNEEQKKRCIEPAQTVLQGYSERYVGANSNQLLRGLVAKIADFASRGADGVISAVGLGCMVGVSAASTIPAIRKHYRGIPIISLTYEGQEGPSQQIRLETFVHQVKQRYSYQNASYFKETTDQTDDGERKEWR